MAANSLSLPIDIPWERWCVSDDMTDVRACDKDRPAKWQSSIAVFRYVPDDDYQTYPGRKITYVKVVCTISGYQPKAEEIQGVLSGFGGLSGKEFTQDELERKLATYRPCNEAIVQVTVAPPANAKTPLEKYPYFMDFQPKKRELLEVATETAEVMSRSLESLNIKKSAGTTQSQEVLDIDQGFSVAGSGEGKGPVGGGGGSFSYSQQGQWGTKQIGTAESGVGRTTDESRERRETLSHTTQLTQLRHLLDSYHLGTNRAVFFVQPRPHVVQEPSGLVSGPRPVEGIQEFFLIVNQPAGEPDFCLDVRLDTGHLYERPVMEHAYKSDTPDPQTLANPTPLPADTDLVADGSTTRLLRSDSLSLPLIGTVWSYDATGRYNCFKRTRSGGTPYTSPDADYVIDVDNVQKRTDGTNGYKVLTATTQTVGDATCSVNPTVDGEALEVNMQATSRACFKRPANEVQVNASINSTALAAAITASTLANPLGGPDPFLLSLAVTGASALVTYEAVQTAAAYASAPNAINQQASSATVALEVFLRSREKILDTGGVERTFFMTTRGLCCCSDQRPARDDGFVYESSRPITWKAGGMTLAESEQLRMAMRHEMLGSLVSSRRTAPRPLAETQMAVDLVMPMLLQNPVSRASLRQPCGDVLPEDAAAGGTLIRNGIRHLSRLHVLSTSVPALARATGLEASAVHELKAAILKGAGDGSSVRPNKGEQPQSQSRQPDRKRRKPRR